MLFCELLRLHISPPAFMSKNQSSHASSFNVPFRAHRVFTELIEGVHNVFAKKVSQMEGERGLFPHNQVLHIYKNTSTTHTRKRTRFGGLHRNIMTTFKHSKQSSDNCTKPAFFFFSPSVRDVGTARRWDFLPNYWTILLYPYTPIH